MQPGGLELKLFELIVCLLIHTEGDIRVLGFLRRCVRACTAWEIIQAGKVIYFENQAQPSEGLRYTCSLWAALVVLLSQELGKLCESAPRFVFPLQSVPAVIIRVHLDEDKRRGE